VVARTLKASPSRGHGIVARVSRYAAVLARKDSLEAALCSDRLGRGKQRGAGQARQPGGRNDKMSNLERGHFDIPFVGWI
jgi:hypothetical protein